MRAPIDIISEHNVPLNAPIESIGDVILISGDGVLLTNQDHSYENGAYIFISGRSLVRIDSWI